ncbi:MAG: cytochrome c3 family protein [Acidobacteriota bacterium]
MRSGPPAWSKAIRLAFRLLAPPLLVPVLLCADDTGRCGVCHGDVRVLFEAGIHHKEQISCVSCHGGDEGSDDLRAAHGGEPSAPARRKIPELCASCHSDIGKMKVYNLPTDQYALYQSSQHGIMLARGNTDVAVCTDCHGVHDIYPRSDPRSSVYRSNIPKTCARCHSDPALIKKYHWASDPYREFAGSVHGRALLEQGDLGVPDCSRCHGVHGAAPPGVGDVAKVCGQCHGAAREYFELSPHRSAMAAAGEPECASCHSNHSTQPAGDVLLGTSCKGCHGAGDPAMKVAREIHDELTDTRRQVDRASGLIADAEAVPLNVDDYRARLEEARSYLTESLPAVHSFSLAQVRAITVRSRSICEEIIREVQEKLDGLRWRKYGLVIFWFYLILTLVILTRFKRGLGAAVEKEETGQK